MKYSRLDIDRIDQASDIRDIVPGLKGTGASRYCTCPECGKSGKNRGLIVTHKRDGGKIINIAKCFSCGFSIGSSIKALEYFENLSFVDAVGSLARMYRVSLDNADKPRSKRSAAAESIRGSFCERQLHESGLSIDDVMVKVPKPDSDEYTLEPAFRKGGADNIVHNLNDRDDEMLIHYYDLEGNHLTFQPKRTSAKPKPYVRVRWSNPFAHSFEEGKEIKYQTPKGAQCVFYIPQYIRERYKNSEHIETLIIQEGEKKAEKACKHDIPSLGIQGIYNIGNAENGLHKELQYIVQRCKVKNIVLLMDSDWDQLGRSLQPGSHIDARPNQFSKAVIKFQKYVMTLHQMQIHVDVFFGHINTNDWEAKGIDDLLVRGLNCREHELKEDISNAMLSHDGHGRFVDIHKVTTLTEHQIRDFWHLNSSRDFFNKYRDRINELASFRFGHIYYVVEDGKIQEAARNAADSNFWTVDYDDKGRKKVGFKYKGALDFLEANRFFKIHTRDLKPGEFKLVKIDDFIVSEVSDSQIRDFVYGYVEKSTKDEEVLDMFISRLENLLGTGKLERLSAIDDNFDTPEPMAQTYHYLDGSIRITADGIEKQNISQNVWSDAQIKRNFKRVPIIKYMQKRDDGIFEIDFTDEGNKCEFLEFIIRASDFWKGREDVVSDTEIQEWMRHIINKITAIGYLLNSWKPRSEQICIVAMDAKMDEVGASNGRSGKSMIGQALQKILNVTTLDCKKIKNDDDFIYSLVTPKTRVFFMDDTRVNFDFENFYSALTGDLQVNPKQGVRYEIKYERAPKFFLTTNHALNDQSDSGKDRRVMLAFSNYFSTSYSPSLHFGHMLFDDWDDYQWNLFDNLMMECVMYYLRSMSQGWTRTGRGVVLPPPMQSLERCSLRQQMGEAFLQWAEAYFDPSTLALNAKIPRKDLSEKYHAEFPSAKESIRASDFRKRMIAFCKYKGYHFNPMSKNEDGVRYSDWKANHSGESFVGESYKSNSREYWMVASEEYANSQPW